MIMYILGENRQKEGRCGQAIRVRDGRDEVPVERGNDAKLCEKSINRTRNPATQPWNYLR